MSLRFTVLASGSGGNATLVQNGCGGVLIDAGLGKRQLTARLAKVGASWEGFALQQVASILELRREERFFWATHGGAELDLLVVRGRKRWGVEFKLTAQPAVTRSMTTALEDLRLSHLFVVHAGMDTFPMTPKISAVALPRIPIILLFHTKL